jgi:hypothetical protein
MATFQIPAGLRAVRWGETRLLAAATAATALGFVAVGFAGGYAVFCTVGVGASALSPSVYGGVSDRGRVPLALRVVGSLVFLTLPLTPLRPRPLAASPA